MSAEPAGSPPRRRKVADDLLVEAGRGDMGAYARFYDVTAPLVFGILRAALGESTEAERAAVRIYVELWRTAPRFGATSESAYSLLLVSTGRELTGRICGMGQPLTGNRIRAPLNARHREDEHG